MCDAIPDLKDPEQYKAVAFRNSDFVELKSDDRFDIKMQYPILGMKYAEKQCFVRKEVFEMLQNASTMLPDGYKFRILDAWRPFQFQKELYEFYAQDIIKEFGLEDCTEEQKKSVITKFVSNPIEDKDCPPVHTTGGAIDLTILDATGKELEMGTGFDDFSDRAYTAAFESEKDKVIRNNRRMLYRVMISVGFTNLPSEWWHYDYGDRFWAYYKQQSSIYRGVFTKEELNEKLGQ